MNWLDEWIRKSLTQSILLYGRFQNSLILIQLFFEPTVDFDGDWMHRLKPSAKQRAGSTRTAGKFSQLVLVS